MQCSMGTGPVLGGALLDAINVAVAIGGQATALGFPYHLSQAFHDFMVCLMRTAQVVAQLFKCGLNADGLVDAELLCDAQVHCEVQEGVGSAFLYGEDGCERCVLVSQVCMVFRVEFNPLARQCFHRCEWERLCYFAVCFAKKMADVVLAGREHGW